MWTEIGKWRRWNRWISSESQFWFSVFLSVLLMCLSNAQKSLVWQGGVLSPKLQGLPLNSAQTKKGESWGQHRCNGAKGPTNIIRNDKRNAFCEVSASPALQNRRLGYTLTSSASAIMACKRIHFQQDAPSSLCDDRYPLKAIKALGMFTIQFHLFTIKM